ncbi:MAG TPA: c-type cytochrome [Anaeromyxobacteraceae bacterium]|nr:c-type cytochrome [Anaeromyxobacteraceae bacterium]
MNAIWKRAPAVLAVLSLSGAAASAADGPKLKGKAKRGEYLVRSMGCNDCHTPWKMGQNGPEPDMTRMLSGHPSAMVMPPPPKLPEGPWLTIAAATMTAWAGPWGVSFTANITPDPETGIGKWTERNFIDTIRNGKVMGKGRALLPPMPWPMYRNLTDDDLKAIFAYLKAVPPLKNKVPEPIAPDEAPKPH